MKPFICVVAWMLLSGLAILLMQLHWYAKRRSAPAGVAVAPLDWRDYLAPAFFIGLVIAIVGSWN